MSAPIGTSKFEAEQHMPMVLPHSAVASKHHVVVYCMHVFWMHLLWCVPGKHAGEFAHCLPHDYKPMQGSNEGTPLD